MFSVHVESRANPLSVETNDLVLFFSIGSLQETVFSINIVKNNKDKAVFIFLFMGFMNLIL
ncbi:MAG: hypothetical protein P8X62_08830 [Flavobacteriaceae bacterium]